MIPPRIKDVKILEDYKLEITYVTDEIKIYDMTKNLNIDFYKKLNNK